MLSGVLTLSGLSMPSGFSMPPGVPILCLLDAGDDASGGASDAGTVKLYGKWQVEPFVAAAKDGKVGHDSAFASARCAPYRSTWVHKCVCACWSSANQKGTYLIPSNDAGRSSFPVTML